MKVGKDSQLHVEHTSNILSDNVGYTNSKPKKSQVNTSTKTVAKRHNPFYQRKQ